MRKQEIYAAYLDNFNVVTIYFSTMSYGGISKLFYIEDEHHHQMPLTIVKEVTEGGQRIYTCSIEGTIEFGKQYNVYHEHARYTPLQFAGIVKQPLFDDLFYYAKNDLGANYSKCATTFKVWAPTSYKVWLEVEGAMYAMQRGDRGVYAYTINENILHASYLYYVEVNGEVYATQDPYAKATTLNSKRSVIVQSEKILNAHRKIRLNTYSDAIIYEMSVRDFSSKGTYLSLIEDGVIEYIKDLGVTHIQLLPIHDFGSVDDANINTFYNWGYDVISWMTLENSYSSQVHNPIQVIKDAKTFIQAVHKQGINVNVDVVFNHMYDIEQSSLHKCVPYYYYQYDPIRGYSNASACGNDIDSTRMMCSKLIVDSCEYLLREYDIDGLRFDLMGILDIRTMNEIAKRCQSIKPKFMVYGEGWNMPSFLAENQRATIQNQEFMPNIAHFSDRFRDVMKAGTMDANKNEVGYLLGDTSKIYKAMNVLGAATQSIGEYPLFNNPNKSVNYVECHDNQTSWDRINDIVHGSEEDKIRYHKLLLAGVILSQGIPFIHGGQEFARTKKGLHNTYNTSDAINHIDWKRLVEHKEIHDYVKRLIQIRKTNEVFRLDNIQDIHQGVTYETVYEQALKYKIIDAREEMIVFFNPTRYPLCIDAIANYSVIYHDDEQVIFDDKMVIPAIGLIILHRKKQ